MRAWVLCGVQITIVAHKGEFVFKNHVGYKYILKTMTCAKHCRDGNLHSLHIWQLVLHFVVMAKCYSRGKHVLW